MSTGYQIYDKSGSYFLTFQVVDLLEKAEDWIYSSQRKYSGLESIIEVDLMGIKIVGNIHIKNLTTPRRRRSLRLSGIKADSNHNGSSTYNKNPQNPKGWQEVSRTRNSGKPHGRVEPPYILNQGHKARSANPSEISTDLSKNDPLLRFLYPTTKKP